MSLQHNHVTLMGNLTRDPEVRALSNGQQHVANFGLAVNRRWRDQAGEEREEVLFIDCEVWGRTGENVGQYLSKGSPVFVEGRLKLDTWEDKNGGGQRSKIKVVAVNVQFLGAPKRGESERVEPADDAAVPAGAGLAASPRGRTVRPTGRRPAVAESAQGEEEAPF